MAYPYLNLVSALPASVQAELDGLVEKLNKFLSREHAPSGTHLAITATSVTMNGVMLRTGAGTPEAVITAPRGSLFLRTDGGAATTLYVKESGDGNTGWVGK